MSHDIESVAIRKLGIGYHKLRPVLKDQIDGSLYVYRHCAVVARRRRNRANVRGESASSSTISSYTTQLARPSPIFHGCGENCDSAYQSDLQSWHVRFQR